MRRKNIKLPQDKAQQIRWAQGPSLRQQGAEVSVRRQDDADILCGKGHDNGIWRAGRLEVADVYGVVPRLD